MPKEKKDFDKDKMKKAVDHFKKAWKIAKMGEDIDVSADEFGFEDYSNDDVADYYYKLQYTGKNKQPIKLEYKFPK